MGKNMDSNSNSRFYVSRRSQEFNLRNLAHTNIPERSKGSDLSSDASASRVRIPLLVHNPGQTVSTALTELVSITSRIAGSTVRRCRLTVRTWAFEAYNSGSNPDNASFPVSLGG